MSFLIMYTSAMRATQPTVMAIAMMGRFTLANSSLRTCMCFLPRISRQSSPASDALKAVLKAP